MKLRSSLQLAIQILTFQPIKANVVYEVLRIKHTRYTLCGDEIILKIPLLPDPFSFLGGTGPSPSYPLWTGPTSLSRSQPSLVLLPMQDKTEEKSSCSACGHPLQDTTHLLLDCLASEPLLRAIFGTTTSIFDLWSRPWVVARLLGLCGVPPRPHPLEGVG